MCVADGFKLPVQFVCKQVKWSAQGAKFCTDLLAMPIGGYGVILGIQWLSTLGDICCNFQQLHIKFLWEGKQVHLSGIKKSLGGQGTDGSLPMVNDAVNTQQVPLKVLDKSMVQKQGKVTCDVLVQELMGMWKITLGWLFKTCKLNFPNLMCGLPMMLEGKHLLYKEAVDMDDPG